MTSSPVQEEMCERGRGLGGQVHPVSDGRDVPGRLGPLADADEDQVDACSHARWGVREVRWTLRSGGHAGGLRVAGPLGQRSPCGD